MLLISWLLGLSLDLALSPLFPLAWTPLLTPGPLSLLLPLFVPYFSSIPPVSSSSVGPMSVSTKTMTYLLGLQLTASSASSLVTSVLRLYSPFIGQYSQYSSLIGKKLTF